ADSTSTSTPAPNPNEMDLSAFQKAPSNQLSNAKCTLWVQLNLFFCCGQANNVPFLSPPPVVEVLIGQSCH
ncbi:hypothetical protein VP01_8343g1, partial [Puccinia sorghi]